MQKDNPLSGNHSLDDAQAVDDAQAALTIELLGYGLLLLVRDCCYPEDFYDLIPAEEFSRISGRGELFAWDSSAQINAEVGALVNGNTVAAYNYFVYAFERLKVLDIVEGCKARQVIIPLDGLGEHLTDNNLLDFQLFQNTVAIFYNCQHQCEWGVPHPRFGNIPIAPNLQGRFEKAGLLNGDGKVLEWSMQMKHCYDSYFNWGYEHIPAEKFFREVYPLDETPS